MKIGILAVQGAFAEHAIKFRELNIECFEIRNKENLLHHIDGLVLPGGESTAMNKILIELDMVGEIKKIIEDDIPVLATCAGMILLAKSIMNDNGKVCFGTMPIIVKRNAYGRQLGSFTTKAEVKYMGKIMLCFIRAPYIVEVGEGVEVLAVLNGKIVGAQYRNQVALSFHPELTENIQVHKYFVDLVEKRICNLNSRK